MKNVFLFNENPKPLSQYYSTTKIHNYVKKCLPLQNPKLLASQCLAHISYLNRDIINRNNSSDNHYRKYCIIEDTHIYETANTTLFYMRRPSSTT